MLSAGAYGDAIVRPSRWITVRIGGRVDLAKYDALLTSFEEPSQPGVHHVTPFGLRAGPKATVDLHLGHGFSVLASYGSGFRSPDVTDVSGAALSFATMEHRGRGQFAIASRRERSAAAQWITTVAAFSPLPSTATSSSSIPIGGAKTRHRTDRSVRRRRLDAPALALAGCERRDHVHIRNRRARRRRRTSARWRAAPQSARGGRTRRLLLLDAPDRRGLRGSRCTFAQGCSSVHGRRRRCSGSRRIRRTYRTRPSGSASDR